MVSAPYAKSQNVSFGSPLVVDFSSGGNDNPFHDLGFAPGGRVNNHGPFPVLLSLQAADGSGTIEKVIDNASSPDSWYAWNYDVAKVTVAWIVDAGSTTYGWVYSDGVTQRETSVSLEAWRTA